MPYKELLKEIILNSGLSYKEISQKCTSLGTSVDPSYISKIVNGKTPAPSEEISRVLAKSCEVNENLLVLESLLDKAPKELKDFIMNIKFCLYAEPNLEAQLISELNNKTYNFSDEVTKYKMTLENQPLSKFIININTDDILKTAIAITKYKVEYYYGNKVSDLKKEVEEHPNDVIEDILEKVSTKSILDNLPTIDDDSMAPRFPKGTKVIIEDNIYANGDIVGYFDKKTAKTLVRKYSKQGDIIIFSPINSDFEPLLYKESEIMIIGKVNKAINFL